MMEWYQDYKTDCDKGLEVFFEAQKKDITSTAQAHLLEAAQYAVMNGGKRMRMVLGVLCYELGEDKRFDEKIIPALVSLELIHAYSLVHDDLPCMDNDEIRRGNPTVWKKYGETTAVLVGDLLQTMAFENITTVFQRCTGGKLTNILASASGISGMIGGQAEDIWQKDLDLESLIRLHQKKTGALLKAACQMGAIIGGYQNPDQLKMINDFASYLGFAYQVKDDLLDAEGTEAETGKKVGKDTHKGIVSMIGVEAAKQTLQTNLTEAQNLAQTMGSEKLVDLVHYVGSRKA